MTMFFSSSGIEKDAVTIFTRFISPDAARPIPITEQMRNDIVGKASVPTCSRSARSHLLRSPLSALVPAARICGEDGMVDPNCFVTAQAVVRAVLEDL